ncbi:MAG: ATP-dependent protease ATPase subunit HslU [Chloroflexi bacterium]|nr:ATP-dependent protease ATPase subunit HslU [Chloroflexota bacterium]
MTVPTPRSIVEDLDRYVIGQQEAKRALAVALSNRERRRKLPPDIRADVMPKNILMMGPTGVGKTELARRVAGILDAPFTKVEATKFTEVGYVGRDVESIIHDLVEVSAAKVYREEVKQIESNAEKLATERIATYLYQQMATTDKQVKHEGRRVSGSIPKMQGPHPSWKGRETVTLTRAKLAKLLASRKLEDQLVEIEVSDPEPAGAGFDPRLEMDMVNDGVFGDCRNQREPSGERKRKVRVKEARRILTREEANKLLDYDQVVDEAMRRVEDDGVVFIDELDKICGPKLDLGRDISGEGVQRDLLPLLEGTTVATRYGPVKTDHILFVAAGTFSKSKPTDLIPELQGRFPLRVELNPLSQQDLETILVEPRNSLVKQYEALLATEGLSVVFTEDGVQEIARLATLMNERTENTGARRLFTIVEKLVEDLSFTAPERKGQRVEIDAPYVIEQVGDMVKDENLGRYIL